MDPVDGILVLDAGMPIRAAGSRMGRSAWAAPRRQQGWVLGRRCGQGPAGSAGLCGL